MTILTNCLTDTADEGSVKVAASLAKRLKQLYPDTKLISYGKNHPLCDHHLSIQNKLMLSGRLMRLLRHRRDTVLYLPLPARFLTTAARTFVVSVFARRRVLLLLPMRSPKIGRMARLLMRLSGARLIVLSNGLRQEYEKLFPGRVAYVRAGVDTQIFMPEPESRLRLRAKYSVPEDKPVVLHVGHLKEGRNVGTLLSLDERFYVVLVASTCTAHERDEALRQSLADRGNITIIDDFIPDIQEVYRMADVYYFPVEHEKHCISAPLSVLEAAACGLPVVCTRFSELKQLEGEEGFYFIDSFDPVPLNALIDRAIRDGVSGRASALRYDWPLAAQTIAAMVQSDSHSTTYSDAAETYNMNGGK